MRERYWYVSAWGMWFCLVKGWCARPEDVHGGARCLAVAKIVKSVQPGVVLVEVSA